MPKTVMYSDKRSKSTIDLVFMTSLLKNSLIICQIKKFKYKSDHYSIITHINLETRQQLTEDKHQFRKTNQKKLIERFNEETQALSKLQPRTKKKINGQVRLLTIAIQRSIEFSIFLVQICKCSVPKFDCECKKAQMQARHLHKIYQREGINES